MIDWYYAGIFFFKKKNEAADIKLIPSLTDINSITCIKDIL